MEVQTWHRVEKHDRPATKFSGITLGTGPSRERSMNIGGVFLIVGVVILGVLLFALARWSRRRNNAITASEISRGIRCAPKPLLRSAPFKSMEDLFLGTLATPYSVAGWLFLLAAFLGGLAFVAVAVYAILHAK